MVQEGPVAHLALSTHAEARDEADLLDYPVLNTTPKQGCVR